MKKYKNLIYLLAILLISMVLIQFLEPTIGGTLTTILTSFTTIIGIFSVFYEMKRSADIEECNFILETYKHFTSDNTHGISIMYEKLDAFCLNGTNTITKKDRKYIVEYLRFFEMMASLVVQDVINIKDIDSLYAYPFFIAMNCKTIQELELFPSKEYYEGIFKIYPVWVEYRKFNNKSIPLEKSSLI